MYVKGCKCSILGIISSRDLICSIVIIVKDTEFLLEIFSIFLPLTQKINYMYDVMDALFTLILAFLSY